MSMLIQITVTLHLVYSNDDHMLFQSFCMKQPFKNDIDIQMIKSKYFNQLL